MTPCRSTHAPSSGRRNRAAVSRAATTRSGARRCGQPQREVCGDEVATSSRNISTERLTLPVQLLRVSKGSSLRTCRGAVPSRTTRSCGAARKPRARSNRSASGGITRVHGGLLRRRSGNQAVPGHRVHAFSARDLAGSGDARVRSRTLTELREAGLSSLPGSRQILDDEVRQVICPDKVTTAQWSTARRCPSGWTSLNVTMMFGHVETPCGRVISFMHASSSARWWLHRVRAAPVRAHRAPMVAQAGALWPRSGRRCSCTQSRGSRCIVDANIRCRGSSSVQGCGCVARRCERSRRHADESVAVGRRRHGQGSRPGDGEADSLGGPHPAAAPPSGRARGAAAGVIRRGSVVSAGIRREDAPRRAAPARAAGLRYLGSNASRSSSDSRRRISSARPSATSTAAGRGTLL